MSAQTRGGIRRVAGASQRRKYERYNLRSGDGQKGSLPSAEEEEEKRREEEFAEYERQVEALMRSIDEIAADENMLERQKRRFGEFLRATKRLGVDDWFNTRYCGVTPQKILEEVLKDCESEQHWTLDMAYEMWSLHCHSRWPPFALGMDFGDKVKEAIRRLLEHVKDEENDVIPQAVYDLLDDQTKASVPIAAVRGELRLLSNLAMSPGIDPQPRQEAWMRKLAPTRDSASLVDIFPLLGLETVNPKNPVHLEKLRLLFPSTCGYFRPDPESRVVREEYRKFEEGEKQRRIKRALASGNEEYAKRLKGYHYKRIVYSSTGVLSASLLETKPPEKKEDSL